MAYQPPKLARIELCNRERKPLTLEEAGRESSKVLTVVRQYLKTIYPQIDNINLGIDFVREGGKTIGEVFAFDEGFTSKGLEDDLVYVPDD